MIETVSKLTGTSTTVTLMLIAIAVILCFKTIKSVVGKLLSTAAVLFVAWYAISNFVQ